MSEMLSPDDVQLVTLGFDISQFWNHGQVGDLSRGPTKLENAHQADEDDQVAEAIRRLAHAHAADKHQRKRNDYTYRTFPCKKKTCHRWKSIEMQRNRETVN